MEDISVLKSTSVTNDRTYITKQDLAGISRRKSGLDRGIVTLLAEGGINFYRYLKRLNLSKESDILVLPSNHHYYYDGKELKSIRILINLRKLNLIKHLDIFLNTLVRILPPNANFIGCFSDSNTLKDNGLPFYHPARIFSRFINFLDSRTDHILNKNEVSELLERNGFRTIDMKEMNGLTYFCCAMSGTIYN